jgi:hypothetical protein
MTDEIDRLRADLKAMTEYASKLDESNDDYQSEIVALRAELAESEKANVANIAYAKNLAAELAEANAIIHGMQDGALVRDQMGIIERANVRIAALEAENRLLRARPMHKRPDFRDGIPSDEE